MFSQLTLQDLGALGEFVGALGVVISLIYLARQLSQNTDFRPGRVFQLDDREQHPSSGALLQG